MAKTSAVSIRLRDLEAEGDYLEEHILLQGGNEGHFEKVGDWPHAGPFGEC